MSLSDAPHRRKLARAMEHLEEVERELGRYNDNNPCIALRDTDSETNPRIWRIRGYVSKQPSPELPLILGDLVHNVRAALDHLAAALKPDGGRSRTQFPIERNDPWRRNPQTRRYIERHAWVRTNFLRNIEGMNPTAQAHIKRVQPYNEGYEAIHHPLVIVNALDNADKHRELIPVVCGLKDLELRISGPDFTIRYEYPLAEAPMLSGGILAELRVWPNDLKTVTTDQGTVDAILACMAKPDAQVNMELTGTPLIAIEMREKPGAVGELPNGLHEMLDGVVSYIVEALELYIPS